MDDLISRQAAIEAIEEYADRLQMVNWKENPNVPYKAFALNWCINTIRDLPSAERKKGKWILVKGSNGKDYHKCSQCLHTQEITGVKNYCAICGADMRGEEE